MSVELHAPLHPVATGDRSPVSGDSPDLGATRESLLATYNELLVQIRGLAGDPRRADELARLAEAAARLTHGGFVQRLVFGERG
jgi:hypothetical protein